MITFTLRILLFFLLIKLLKVGNNKFSEVLRAILEVPVYIYVLIKEIAQNKLLARERERNGEHINLKSN